MKKLFLILLVISCTNLFSQETIEINMFASSKDFLANTYSYEGAQAVVYEVNDLFIKLGKFSDKKTGKKIRGPIKYSCIIEFEGVSYFNFGYVYDLNKKNLFVKLDIVGNRMGAIFLDRYALNEINATNPGSYGGGLAGVLMKESEKWGANWSNNEGEKFKIVVIDFELIQPKFGNRNESSLGFFLTKRHLIHLLGLDKKVKDLKEMTFEEAVALLGEVNS